MLMIKLAPGERVCVGDSCVVEMGAFGESEARILVWTPGGAFRRTLRVGGVSLSLAGGRVQFNGLQHKWRGAGVLGFEMPRSVRIMRREIMPPAEAEAVEAAAGCPARSTPQGGRP